MNFKRMWAMFQARNHEFFRDRAAFGWNFAFPFLIIIGFGLIFGNQDHQTFKVGLFSPKAQTTKQSQTSIPSDFLTNDHLEFIDFPDQSSGEERLRHHKIDLLIDRDSAGPQYWVNDSSPKGYLAEQILLAALLPPNEQPDRQLINGQQIRYLDWLFPGILAMNMMFSALWGVGYVVVRYRKNGTLKRLKATPLTALEYLSAQMLSRIFLLLFTTSIVWFGADLIFNFQVQGSYLLIFFLFVLGGLSLCSIGLVLAARGTSEEFTSGVLNFISWPMMFLSEVWFSLEGSPIWIQKISLLFPLTHLLTAVRKVMNEGAGLMAVQIECLAMTGFTLIFLALAALLFSWND
ncbi:MAG: ABC transporter permease [Desulfobulbaceae bacterium]|uniref:ABC transporter permease n=1 Tax=Candidatus Desulfatifera sulfidica TaxID=2841691 RepID=A0A8J6N8U2_9BACT|nr:ABC transporter permease [Candidatus Desulfatifera sulfidica]